MKKLLFFFFFFPKGTAITADDFRTAFPEVEVIVLDDLGPIDTALSEVAETCENEHPDVIVGVGIGGMIAEQMHGFHKVLINPEFIFPQGTCSDSNKILDNQFKGITEFDKENTYAFISDEFNLMGGLSVVSRQLSNWGSVSGYSGHTQIYPQVDSATNSCNIKTAMTCLPLSSSSCSPGLSTFYSTLS